MNICWYTREQEYYTWQRICATNLVMTRCVSFKTEPVLIVERKHNPCQRERLQEFGVLLIGYWCK